MMLPPELADKSDLELQRLGAREKLRLFGQYVTPAWDWTPRHIELMAKKLEAVERGEIKRLMIFMPPRHSKSETSTIHFPAWYMLRHPEHRVIVASYSSSLAQDFSIRTRAIVREFGQELYGIELSDESASVEQWALKKRHGMYVAAGYGSGITGRGCSLLVLDDVIKNAEEANSPTYRQKIWDWYVSTAYTRLEPDGAIILTITRWNDDDLAGRLLRQMEIGEGDNWDVVRLPAVAEDSGDTLGRSAGEPLWPSRFDNEALERIRRTQGTYFWMAQYQQRPQAIEGGAFKASWFRWYTKQEVSFNESDDSFYFLGSRLRIFAGIDLATTEKTSSDDFALVVIGITDALDVLVLDVVSGQFDPGDQGKIVVDSFEKWLPERIAVEDNGGQKYFVSQLKRWHQVHPGTPRMPIKGITNTGDKYSRITRNVPWVENGGLYLRQSTDGEEGWIDMERLPNLRIHPKMSKLYEQMVAFAPKMAHEDVADAMDMSVNVAARNGRFLEDWSKQAALRDPGAWRPGGAVQG